MYLPSNNDESGAKTNGWALRILIVCVGVGLGWGLFAMEQKEWYIIPLGVLSIVLGLVLGYFVYGWGYDWIAMKSTCPNCKKPFCIEYTKEKTISESVVTERKGKRTEIASYRVGVKGINWRCTSCGYEGYGEKNYKEQI